MAEKTKVEEILHYPSGAKNKSFDDDKIVSSGDIQQDA